ncbi:MAG: helix-turn-helix transcriptional regulator [Clostridia bacterium]|nr:helix-turn-helix transcriptional regulator [Clostridia bacterium]
MTENDFRRIIADNLIFYRKRAELTQAEVAAHINYSDKSVSKWERGDGCPDVFVLSQLAEKFGVTLNELVSERAEDEETALVPDEIQTEIIEPEPVLSKVAHSPFTMLLAVGAVWLIATIIFSIMNMTAPRLAHTWLAFIYAVPASFAMVEVFAVRWKLPAIIHLLFGSGILWTLMVSLHLTAPDVENIYLIYVIAAVAQLLGIFGLGLYWQMIRWPQRKLRKKRVKE